MPVNYRVNTWMLIGNIPVGFTYCSGHAQFEMPTQGKGAPNRTFQQGASARCYMASEGVLSDAQLLSLPPLCRGPVAALIHISNHIDLATIREMKYASVAHSALRHTSRRWLPQLVPPREVTLLILNVRCEKIE